MMRRADKFISVAAAQTRRSAGINNWIFVTADFVSTSAPLGASEDVARMGGVLDVVRMGDAMVEGAVEGGGAVKSTARDIGASGIEAPAFRMDFIT